MKKVLISVFALGVLTLTAIYIFIPSQIKFSKIIILDNTVNAVQRFLFYPDNWNKWFPVRSVQDKNFYFNNYQYQIISASLNGIKLLVTSGSKSSKSSITLFHLDDKRVAIDWEATISKTSNPIKKIRNYFEAKKLQRDMEKIVSFLKKFLSKDENIYGVNFQVVMSKDSTLVATKDTTSSYPSTAEIYKLINNLKKYIYTNRAKENNFPMLHVRPLKDSMFETMVAIPVNKRLTGDKNIFIKEFVPWKVLTAEVKGGNYRVNEALKQMKIYIADYQKTAMAMPFESLVTDRSSQPDTLQWITRIYTPIP